MGSQECRGECLQLSRVCRTESPSDSGPRPKLHSEVQRLQRTATRWPSCRSVMPSCSAARLCVIQRLSASCSTFSRSAPLSHLEPVPVHPGPTVIWFKARCLSVSRFISVIGLLVLIIAFMPGSDASQEGECVWAGRVYGDGELKLNGQVCQVCQAGKWVDKAASCDECKPASKPKPTNPVPKPLDCVGRSHRSDPQRLTFSDGARVRQSNGVFQACSSGQWIERVPASNQICDK